MAAQAFKRLPAPEILGLQAHAPRELAGLRVLMVSCYFSGAAQAGLALA